MSPPRARDRDRSQQPQPGPTRKVRFPDFDIHSLENGLQVFLSRYPRGPLVHELLLLPGGAQKDPIDRAGLAALTASVMDEGTDSRDALEIAGEVETLGGYLSSQADWDTMSASIGVLAKHTRQGLNLLAEIATRASFPAREIERLRSQHLAEMQRRRAQPSALASDALFQALYDRTIYATPVIGTPATLAAVDRSEILENARHEISPDGAALIIVGDIEPEVLLAEATEAFGDWRGRARTVPPAIEVTNPKDLRIHIVDRPHAPQTELWMGSIGVARSHPDRAGLMLLNSLLGGKFTSRLNLNLRERLGITYGVSSSFSQRRGPGPFLVTASIETEAIEAAVREILSEIRRLQDALVTDEELADTKSYMLGIFPYTLQRIEGLAARLADLAIFGFPHNYFSVYLEQIAAVTREQLQILAQEHLHPDQMSVVAVGPRHQIEGRLNGFGSPVIHPVDGISFEPSEAS